MINKGGIKMPLESKIKTIPLHCWHDNNITLKATQGEGGIKLCEFQLLDDNGIISLADVTSVLYNGEKSNGQACCITCNIVDSDKGLVEFTVETGITDISGDVLGSIEVISANGSLKFSGVHLNVKKDATGKKIEASDALSALVNALNKLDQLMPEGIIAFDDVVTETGTNAVQGKAIVDYISKNKNIVKYVDLGSVSTLSETPIFTQNTLYKGLCNGFSSTFGYPDNTTQIGFLVTHIPRNDTLKDYALWLLSDGSMWLEIISAKQFIQIAYSFDNIKALFESKAEKTDVEELSQALDSLSTLVGTANTNLESILNGG